MSTKTKAILSLFFVAFCYAILGANSRLLSTGFPPMTQVYLRVFLGFLLTLVVLRKDISLKRILSVPKSDYIWLLLMGTCGYSLSVYFITLASLNTKLVNVGVIFATIPFVVYVYSYFLLKEKIQIKLIFLLLVALFGVNMVVSKGFFPQIDNVGIGELFAVASVLFAGFWSVGRKKVSNHLNNAEITAVVMFIACVSGLFIALLKGETFDIQVFTWPSIWLGLFIGAILNSLLTFLESYAFSHLDIVLANQILMSDNVFALIVGYILYKETIIPIEFMGSVLILSSVLIANKMFAKSTSEVVGD